jgi:hypothetical protein
VGWLIGDSFPFAKAGKQSDPNATMSKTTDREHCSEPNDLNIFIGLLFSLELTSPMRAIAAEILNGTRQYWDVRRVR